jgi:hypothetical protein
MRKVRFNLRKFENFLLWMLSRISGYQNVRLTSIRNLPDQPSGIRGTVWKVIEADAAYTENGTAEFGTFTCGINAYYGIYDAMISGYQSPEQICSSARMFLPAIAKSLSITNFRQVT